MSAKKNMLLYLFICSLAVASCTAHEHTLFTSLSSSDTHIKFENQLEKQHAFGILYYLYYYNGGGVSIGDINNDGLPDIYFTANSKGHNKLYLNKGNFQFEDITQTAQVAGSSDWCTGATMADINGDGLLDIYVSAVRIDGKLEGVNELFINKGNNVFAESAAQCGLNFSGFTTQAVFFDYDHDGDLDCYILNQSHRPNQNIVDTSNRRRFDADAGDRLYRNDGATNAGGLPHFTDVSAQAGIYQSSLGYGLGISVADLNNDGWEDIYIGNDFHENDYYYVNQQNGTFKEEGGSHFGHYSRFSMGNDIADYNNDGQPDIVTVDMLPPTEALVKTYGSDENYDIYKFKILKNGFQDQVSRNCLQRNNGNGTSFSETGLQSGVSATDWSWCPLFADFDNDGNKDLFISSGIVKRPVDLDYVKFVSDLAAKTNRNASDEYDDETIAKMPDGSSHPFLFQGDGKKAFIDVSDKWGTGDKKGYYNGAAYADLDNDGRLDLVINCLNAPALVLKNNAAPKNYLSLSFKGPGLNSNGIGVKAWLFSKQGLQYQQLMLTRGFESSSDTRLHFGIDSVAAIDSLLIVWPNQQYQVIKNVPVNKQLLVSQKEATGLFKYDVFFPPAMPGLEDISSQVSCNWRHKEDDFTDFNLQYLIPHVESTRGPKIAVADVNGDGRDDFYACGAKGQSGSLMIQQADGSFTCSDTALFSKDAICEDVDAVFFDANGDGFNDLFVVSGGNEPTAAAAKENRLYINNGKGHFSRQTGFISQTADNKSCVTVADIDHDGDIDIFVGTLCSSSTYGALSASHLFLNDGKAHFAASPQDASLFKDAGMVTSASFTDLNNDGWADLVVAGEFMPVKIFINHNGSFTVTDIPHSTGLWQTIYSSDVNGDGYSDILAGNWGHNSKLWAGKSGPVKMYVKDFDHNGSVEQILCYTVGGKEYTFLAKDELERALPVLKKAYLKYGEVAGKDVQFIFDDLFKEYATFTAETLSSACFINDGHGNFKQTDLPAELQLAPVFSFAAGNAKNQPYFIAAGNFSGVMPYEGKYDALYPTIFKYNAASKQFYTESILSTAGGEMRDLKWVHNKAANNRLVLARNNNTLLFYQPGKQ
jgi:hypothetical protein